MDRAEKCRAALRQARSLKWGAIAGIARMANVPRTTIQSFLTGQSACPRYDRFEAIERAALAWHSEYEARQQAQPDAGYGAGSGKWAGGEPDSKPDGGRETA